MGPHFVHTNSEEAKVHVDVDSICVLSLAGEFSSFNQPQKYADQITRPGLVFACYSSPCILEIFTMICSIAYNRWHTHTIMHWIRMIPRTLFHDAKLEELVFIFLPEVQNEHTAKHMVSRDDLCQQPILYRSSSAADSPETFNDCRLALWSLVCAPMSIALLPGVTAPYGTVTIITEQLDSPAEFLLHRVLASQLKDGASCIFVSTYNDLNHWSAIQSRSVSN